MVYLVFGKILILLWQFYPNGQVFIVVNGQILNKKSSDLVVLIPWQH